MDYIDSHIFGKTTLLDETDNDFIILEYLINDYPVNAFGIINKRLNTLGYSLTVGKIE